MAKENDARAVFVGPMRFDVTSGSGHTIALDVSPADGGENTAATPMELLLMGLAGVSQCTGRLDEAVTLYRESLIVGKDFDDPRRVVITLIGLAGVEEARGDRKTAGIVIAEAMQVMETRLGVVGGPISDDTRALLRYLLTAGADLELFEAEVVRARLAAVLE